MKIAIARCGCDCVNCPTYRENIKTPEEKKRCSAGWEKHLNINLSPEKLRPCDGCSIPDSERKVYYLNCKVRKCAGVNGIVNCAYCVAFPCEELLTVHSIQQIANRDDFMQKTGKTLLSSEYRRFIEPYTGLVHLNKIRATLMPNEYRDYKRFQVINRFAPPASLEDDRQNSLDWIYDLLTKLGVEENISFARLQTLRNKRKQLLKILWTLAHDGVYSKAQDSLELDSHTFLSQKITASHPLLLEYFSELKKHGIQCEIISVTDKEWLTPTGGLRKEGWVIRLSFGESKFDTMTLAIFKNYIERLANRYDKLAFRFLNAADLNIMEN